MKDLVFYIVGQSTVRELVITNGTTMELIFYNALHTSDLAANLIFISKFDYTEFSVIFAAKLYLKTLRDEKT